MYDLIQLHSVRMFLHGVLKQKKKLSIGLSRAMGKVRINNFLYKETTRLKESEAEATTTWVEAEADDYKTVEAEAEAVDFKNLEAEAVAEAVGI